MNCIVRISAAVCGALLLAGCYKLDGPASEQKGICFEAGSPLLMDDATKGTAVIDGTSFSSGAQLNVIGWHLNSFITFGTTTPVTLGSSSHWSYSPLIGWLWGNSETDYYDFLAVYPYKANRTFSKSGGAHTTASFSYDAQTEQTDLMAAGTRRLKSEGDATVAFQFSHQLSAIRVVVHNDLGRALTLKSLYYKKLIVGGTLQLVIGSSGFATSWDNLNRNTTNQLFGNTNISQSLAVDASYTCPASVQGQDWWDMMIPQSLAPQSNDPQLMLSYSYVDENQVTQNINDLPVSLKTILDGNSSAITSWEAGKKYTYHIYIRMGGIYVNVITTQWDPVSAETPGLQI